MANGIIKGQAVETGTVTNVAMTEFGGTIKRSGQVAVLNVVGRMPATEAWKTAVLATIPAGWRPDGYVYGLFKTSANETFRISVGYNGNITVENGSTAVTDNYGYATISYLIER